MTNRSEGDERMRKLANFIFDIFEVYLAVVIFAALIALRRADHAGMCPGNADAYPRGLVRFADHVRAVCDGAKAFTVRDLAVDGTVVMERLGIGPGPSVGVVLSQLLEAVLDDPALNERERLLEIAERLYRERITPGSAS